MVHDDVFHEGEVLVQERAGQRSAALGNAGIVRNVIPEGARPFLARQRMIVVAHGDAPVWASLAFGEEGFVSSDDGVVVRFDHGLPAGCPVGLLAIDFASRKRLRVNGIAESGGRVRVREAYPNCPKYIQARAFREAEAIDRGPFERGTAIDASRAAVLRRADTLFVASRHPERGMDASHRGGRPGFVRVDGNTLTIPDYVGNGMFNTFGNLVIDPAAGVTVLDFDRGRVLEMTGEAEVLVRGGERSWTFRANEWRESAVPATYRWDYVGPSPYNP